MNGERNGSVIVTEYEFIKPLIHKIDFIIDGCIRDCINEYYHTFDHICENDIQLTNIRNNEIRHITNSEKNMNLYDLNKKTTVLVGTVLYLIK